LTADQSIEGNPTDPRAPSVTDRIKGLDLSPRATRADEIGALGSVQPPRAAIYLSNTETAAGPQARDDTPGDGFDLNFENAPVTTVAKVILGDILGVGYSIDPRVQGTVTLASGRPISKVDALFVLENALRMSNVALLRDRNGYRIVPATEAVGAGGIDKAASAQPGYGMSVVPLRFVSAPTVFKLLDAFGVKPNSVRADPSRNILIVLGSGAERAAAIETVVNFDADWMKGQSVGIFPIRNSSPEPVIAELEKIMDSGEGGLGQNVVKFQPVVRLNSVLVVSQKPEYLKRAGTWIARLDRSDTQGENLKVYPLRYGSAKLVAALLNEIITGRATGGTGSLDSASGQIAPGSGMSSSSSGASGGLGGSTSGGISPAAALSGGNTSGSGGSQAGLGTSGMGASGMGASGNRQEASGSRTTTSGNVLGSFGGGGGSGGQAGGVLQNVRITADVVNNTILVYANQEAQRIVQQSLNQIDRPQRQIEIEATIAEVALNDTLTYGVQSFLTSKNLGLKPNTGSIVNTLATQALSRVLPGFDLLVGSETSPTIILNALHNVTEVKILSNPTLVVLDNQVATLMVGDQIPISTGSATVLTTSNTIVNTVSYQNTGIILRVLPRSNANGNVVLDIEQEISNVPTSSSSTPNLTPTISQRRVKSSIAIASGQTVLLAGLISDSENKTRAAIPVLDRLPGLLGDAFGNQSTTKGRTELILFIRPTIIRNAFDAHIVAEELRTKFNGKIVGTTLPVPVLDAPSVRRQ
jgi:general secretion pathway protein D